MSYQMRVRRFQSFFRLPLRSSSRTRASQIRSPQRGGGSSVVAVGPVPCPRLLRTRAPRGALAACTSSDIRSSALLQVWEEDEGVKWRRVDGRPWWVFCEACHARRWPHDRRTNEAENRELVCVDDRTVDRQQPPPASSCCSRPERRNSEALLEALSCMATEFHPALRKSAE